MYKIKTVSLIGLGAIGTYLATRLCSAGGCTFRVIAGGERASRIERVRTRIPAMPTSRSSYPSSWACASRWQT